MSVGVESRAIFSAFATAIAFGTTSENTMIKNDMTIDEIMVPYSLPNISKKTPVAIVVDKVFAMLVPIKRVLITFSLIFKIPRSISAFLLPSNLSFWIIPGEVAITAVSAADIIPAIHNISRTKDTTIMVVIDKVLKKHLLNINLIDIMQH